MVQPSVPPVSPAARPSPPRTFGRFVLRQLLGKSEATMAWLATDPRTGHDTMLWLPRVQPADAEALEAWLAAARGAARLNHPRLVRVAEVGVASHWPYLLAERQGWQTLGERLAAQPPQAATDAVALVVDALEGLAFVHEGGFAHGDLQLHTVLVDDQGRAAVAAVACAQEPPRADAAPTQRFDGDALRQRRDAAQRDVLVAGLLLHGLVAGRPAFGEADLALAANHLPPRGRDAVRLPWTTPQPVPDALRAICDRATGATESLRYLGARSLLRALGGWRVAHAEERGGALALLIDRLQSVGHLPGTPGAMARVGRLTGAADARRTDELAEEILADTALSLELLRVVNSAQVQATQAPGGGAVLTVRRAIALLGLDGVRRAANALRAWPGPLDGAAATALQRALDRARWAGHTAQALRPAGYDAEVVMLVAVLQNLGRLLLHYHFADEAAQIARLMQPVPAPADAEPGTAPTPGLSETVATQAVLGTDPEAIGAAVARHWGLGDEFQHMMRRVPLGRTPRTPEHDDEMLRLVASAANEAVDAVAPAGPGRAGAALDAVAHRYARALKTDGRMLRDALQSGRTALRAAMADTAPAASQEAV
jgi:HD-like signal output (HDOD) protein